MRSPATLRIRVRILQASNFDRYTYLLSKKNWLKRPRLVLSWFSRWSQLNLCFKFLQNLFVLKFRLIFKTPTNHPTWFFGKKSYNYTHLTFKGWVDTYNVQSFQYKTFNNWSDHPSTHLLTLIITVWLSFVELKQFPESPFKVS